MNNTVNLSDNPDSLISFSLLSVYKQAVVMDWYCCILLQVLAVTFGKNAAASKELKERRLSFVQHSKCTYSYEVAVHTARGSKSTENDGFQIHALVSIYNTLNSQSEAL